MDEETKKAYDLFENTLNECMEDYYLTQKKLVRLFRAYDENSKLYSTINEISSIIYPGDVRIFLNIYEELTEYENNDKKKLKHMKNAAKICNNVSIRSLLEFQLEEFNKISNDNKEIIRLGQRLIDATTNSIENSEYFLSLNNHSNNQTDKPTYH